ncbi:MAG: type III-A CRISPR-associated RAMP protein Csm5 [Bryobacteraceae bacterium]
MADARMKYRLTCLTPTLVGDGQRLAPIDYMVWKNHVNVLDQKRIFKLLAKGPRLDGYLMQLKKAEKLDFGSWGGFAQNFAGRRIPFEHESCAPVWDRTRAEHLFIPTFASGTAGPFLPGSAIKGALRTGMANAAVSPAVVERTASGLTSGDFRSLRRAANAFEDAALGGGGADVMKPFCAADSKPIAESAFKVYLLRVSTLESRGGKYELAWKLSPRGASKRAEDSTAAFAEMATPGTSFEGTWEERGFWLQPEIAHALRKKPGPDRAAIFRGLNEYSRRLLEIHKRYADWTGLALLRQNIEELETQLSLIREGGEACVFPLGWGGGFLSKSAFIDTGDAEVRKMLGQVAFYARPIQSGLPFPKTRRVVFLANQPATLPGWVLFEVSAG